jgi:hypothetical protein
VTDPVYQDEMEQNMDVFERGRILKTVPHDAWEIIKDTIHAYVEDLDRQVRELKPGDQSVMASQAALYALHTFETFFLHDTEAAIEFSTHPSQEFKDYLYGVRESMDVLKQMEKTNTPYV